MYDIATLNNNANNNANSVRLNVNGFTLNTLNSMSYRHTVNSNTQDSNSCEYVFPNQK